ncbi:MAG: hypothetical protein U0441_14505 [Polyangiaceae bacterium]
MIAAAFLVLAPAFVSLSADAPLSGPAPAEASVSVLLSLDELVAASSSVVVGTPAEHKCQWEELGGSKRIVTYTKIKVDKTIAGSAGSEVWVRTLGGVVDNLGQAVSGEAQLTQGSKAVLFLLKRGDVTMVTGMAQGHYPIKVDEKGISRLKASPDAGAQLRPPGPSISARDVLVGQPLDTAVTAISKARKALDEKKK